MIIITGVAGAGKSLQGKMLADQLKLPWLSTGEFLRMLVSGDKRKKMLEGKLLEDGEIITLAQKAFSIVDNSKDFVLDGFPRTVAQADWLLNQKKHQQLRITAVIHLQVSEEVACERLLSRGRQDDTKAAIKERFYEYENAIIPILEHFNDAGVPVIEINAEQNIEAVNKDIIYELSKHDIDR